MNSDRFTPLAEHAELSSIVPDYAQPQLAIDNRRLERVAAVGCFSTINFEIDDAPVSYDTKIVGNVGDVALGGATRAEVKTAVGRFSDESNSKYHTHLPLTVGISREALHSEVRNVRDGKKWKQQLNKAIGGAIVTASWRHLVGDSTRSEIEAAMIMATATPGAGIFFGSYNSGLMAGAVYSFAHNMIMASDQRKTAQKRCHSIMPAFHVDRALAVSALVACKPVIRSL